MNILVLGLGNILLSDEGVGVRIVEALDASHELPDGVEVLDGGTSGMDLLDMVADLAQSPQNEAPEDEWSDAPDWLEPPWTGASA